MDLMEALSRKQREELKANDREFGDLLGVTHSQWVQIRGGKSRMGMNFLSGVTNRFPELEPLVLDYIREFGPVQQA